MATSKSSIASSKLSHILQLSRTLSNTRGLTATLSTILSASTLLHSLVLRLLEKQYTHLAHQLSFGSHPSDLDALQNLPPPHTRLASFCASSASTRDLAEDLWRMLRLFALPNLFSKFIEARRRLHRDPAVKTLLYLSLASGAAFQVLENVAVLASKGVLTLPSKATERWSTSWIMAIAHRFWLAQILLEATRLLRVRQMGWQEELGAEKVKSKQNPVEEGTVRVASAELQRKWTRQFLANAGWLPFTLHWSYIFPSLSPIPEALRGVAGLVPSLIGLQDVWRETA